MKKIFVFILLLAGYITANAQPCTTLGQTPGTAFPVCGTSVFNQTTVPTCGGTSIPVPPCSSPIFDDRNPFFYKFTCFKTGTLGFTITPIQASDDFDWQLFDVTGKASTAIYTDATCFVTCSWSGTAGVTGATSAGSVANACEGGTPPIVSMPTLTQGHDYILFISNFSASNKGYNLEFSGGTSTITDSTPPRIATITNNCIGDKILIKLNKKMRCSTIAANASDFSITTNPTVTSISGFGCATGFDTDSLTVSLASPLPAGSYTVTMQNGSDGNTILDNCGVGIPVGSASTLTVVGAAQPTPMDSIVQPTCNPSSVDLVFKSSLLCSSVALDGSDFTVNGPSPVTVISASIVCSGTLGTRITVNFSAPIATQGNYNIVLKSGSDGNTLLNQCGIATVAGSSLTFRVYNKPNPVFGYTAKETCLADTLNYSHNGNNNTNAWLWTFDGNPTSSTTQTQQVVYTSFVTRQVKLKVTNPACSDSITVSVPITNHSITAQIVVADTTCPTTGTQFLSGSVGLVNSWVWTFGNGNNSTAQNPPLQYYPVVDSFSNYTSKLIVTNTVGCKDSTTKLYVVKPAVAALMDNIAALQCSPTKIAITFTSPMRCNTVAHNGSDFIVTGAAAVIVDSAIAVNCTNGLSRTIEIYFKDSLHTSGTYIVQLTTGSDGNTIINDCGLSTAPSVLSFKSFGKVNPAFTVTPALGCAKDTVYLNHTIANGVDRWRWYLNGMLISDKQSTSIIYDSSSTAQIKLVAINPTCADSSIITTPLLFDTLAANFTISSSLICPAETVLAKDTSLGTITSWKWDFGNGITSNAQNPIALAYPVLSTVKDYVIRLIVENAKPCADTAYQTIRVVPNCLIEVATAFTPNGDGRNDYLYPINAYKVTKLLFRVYNRYGQLIFEGRSYTDKWNGWFNNTAQPNGTYVWTLDYTDPDTGKEINRKGFSVLIR